MDEVVGEIYTTKNYGQFKYFEGNRKPEIRRNLKKSISENGMLVPIIVNNGFEIGDGQARFLAAKETNRPILYRIVSGITFEDIIKMNRTTHNWTLSDYVHRYTVEGNEEYMKLSELHSKNPHIPLSSMARTGMGRSGGISSGVLQVHMGGFNFYNYNAYRRFINEYNRFIEMTGLKSYQQLFMAYFELYTIRNVKIEKLPEYLIDSKVLSELRGNRSQTNIMIKMVKLYNAKHNASENSRIKFEVKNNKLPNILSEKSRELLNI